MEREELINIIIDFFIEYKLFKKSVKIDEIKNAIDEQLNDARFIENLINTIIRKTQNRKNIDTDKVKNLLLELDKIRLELEFNSEKIGNDF
jgi:hypothetical protein